MRSRPRREGETRCRCWERRRAEGAAWPRGTEAEGGHGGPSSEPRGRPGESCAPNRDADGYCEERLWSRPRTPAPWDLAAVLWKAGEPARPSRPGKPVKTSVAMEPNSAGGLAESVETGLMALPREEIEGRLLLYNRRLGSDQCLFGCLSWSASVSQTTARTKIDCRRLGRAA